jgi:hypothetical protein
MTMGIRVLLRSIAKARLAELGAEQINRKMSRAWKSVLYGDLAKEWAKEKRRKERQAFVEKQLTNLPIRQTERRS